jgi:nucleoside-diphosphate-sugar epimerase
MRIVLTGATGFLGSALLPRLLQQGRSVLALGRDPQRLRRELPAGVEAARFDLGDPRPPEGLRPGDAVIHCAALLGNARAGRGEYLRANGEAVRVLALAARQAEAAVFQFISSVSAHGPIGSEDAPLREDTPFRPASLYGESKARAEQLLAGIGGLRVQVLRPPVIYGPGAARHSSASKLFRLLAGDWFPASGDGRRRFNVIARENLVDGMIFLLEKAGAEHEAGAPLPPGDPRGLPPCADTWMLRDDPCPTMIELQDWILGVYGRRPRILSLPVPLLLGLGALGDGLRALGLHFPLSRETARGFATSGYYADPGRLLAAGWRPPLEPRAAIEATAQAYRDEWPRQ